MRKFFIALIVVIPIVGCGGASLIVKVVCQDGMPVSDAIVAVQKAYKPFPTKVRMERTNLEGVAIIKGMRDPNIIQVVDKEGNFAFELLPTEDEQNQIRIKVNPGIDHTRINPEAMYITEDSLYSKMDEALIESWNIGIETAIEIDKPQESNKSSYSTPGSGASLRE